MAASLTAIWAAAMQPPSINQAISGVFGSISLTAWICLLLPQLIANYKAKSADGLSMSFLFIWLLGDVANLLGGLLSSIAPTAIFLAVYFCFADLVLIAQCTYYNTLNARRRAAHPHSHHHRHVRTSSTGSSTLVPSNDPPPSEESPLLSSNSHHNRRRSSSLGLPGSHRRHSTNTRLEASEISLSRIITGEDDRPDSHPWLNNALSLAAVWVVGAAGWFVSYKMGAWDVDAGLPGGSGEDGGEGGEGGQDAGSKVGLALGYLSAVAYLCARIPQIVKNYREKSCEGLALLFFLLSLTGNFTYGASLIAYSQNPKYIITALPWLLGSLGTIVEDFVIFVQFRLYSPDRQAKNTVAVEEAH
ncbi:PQ loop repeat-domain-containing protein [Coniochaeta sp. 2T2.1]|nr:PQ loop repeat-domain-containing protein [Coniochaeta sp. 2T2.1]